MNTTETRKLEHMARVDCTPWRPCDVCAEREAESIALERKARAEHEIALAGGAR